MSETLYRLARHHGIQRRYRSADGIEREVPDATLRTILRGLGVDEAGAPKGKPAPDKMIVPRGVQCVRPDGRGWGLFCQLYELRSDRQWGIGDFSDLAALARICGAAGADFLGVNPLHALFLADPAQCSPFSPSNRRFFNPLYIAPDLLEGCADPGPARHALNGGNLVDYPGVARLKLGALRQVFGDAPFGTYDQADFDAFVSDQGEALRRHAEFEAISARMVAEGHGASWHDWPETLHDPDAPAVRALLEGLDDEVQFHLWLQWIAARQIDEAAGAAREAGMGIGLYLDLAVGEAPGGSATWSGAAAMLPGVRVGAPPDLFSTEGQDWGLAAPSPTALAAAGFAPFRDMIAAQLAHAGALRIDHVMALWQLFLIPVGERPLNGTYLRAPFGDLLRVLSELSQRHDAVIIGEDLGSVPDGFRDAMKRAGVLAYRVLYFEQDENGFVPPRRYPELAMACLSTHDLPTLAAWWRGDDIALRKEHGLVDAETSAEHAENRKAERKALIAALRRARALLDKADADAPDLPPEVLAAAYRFVGQTRSRLAALRLSDMVGPERPTNLPGTVDAYPNWRPRGAVPVDEIADHPAFQAVTAALRDTRPKEVTE